MSGLDVIAVLGLLASIEQLVESTYKVVNHAVAFYRNSKDLPKTLEEVRTFLPFLAMAVRNRSDPLVLGRLNEEGRQALMSIFEDLKKRIQELQKLLNDYLPSEDTSTSTKFLKAMGSLTAEKKIDKIMKVIFERYMPVLTLATIENPNLQMDVIKTALETTIIESRANSKPKPYFLVNVQRDDDFVGRQEVMIRLNALITPVERHNRVALVALGGMGKTRIALECALKYRKSEDISVYWVHASSVSRIAEAYNEIAKQVGIAIDTNPTAYDLQSLQKDTMKAIKNWLESEASGRWLMVIDNADDRDLLYGEPKLAEYFPRSDSGSIIMTTRDKSIGLKFTGSASKIVIVEAFDNASSRSLLEAKLGSETADECSCRQLSEELEGMPLALVQAAAYINEQSISIQEYLTLYRGSESSKIDLLSEDFEDVVRSAQDTKSPIAITWVISFEIIRKRDPLAAELLSKLCIMDSQALPLSLLEGNEDNQSLVKALGTLQAFSMITLRKTDGRGTEEKSFDLHRLVRLSMRNWLKIHNQLDHWTAIALKNMALKYPDIESTRWQHQEKWRAYLPHALAILASDYFNVTSENSDIAEVFLLQALMGHHTADGIICGLCTADLMCQVSWTFAMLESKRDWALWAERGLSLREHILGPEHSDTISAMMLYAKASLKTNRREEAEKVAKRAIEITARTQQPLSNQAKSLEAQAIIMTEYEQHKEAEKVYMQMVELYRNACGPEHNGTLVALDMLGFNYRHQGKYEEAEKIFKQVLEVWKRIYGPEYIDTLLAMSHLSSLYFEMERYDEAGVLDTAISEMWNNNAGPPHPSGVMAIGNLAADYFGQERYAEAVELGLKALKLYEEVCGPEDYETINTMANLSYAYRKMRQYDEAEKLGSRVLELHMKNSGPAHIFTSTAMSSNAIVYEDQKKYAAAEALRKEALQIIIGVFGVHDGRTFQGVKNLLGNYELQCRFADALTCELDFLCMVTSAVGPKHSDVVYRTSAVAAAQANDQRYNEAEGMAQSAMKLATECDELDQSTMIYCKMTLGSIAGRFGRYSESEHIYREVLEIYAKDQKPNNVGIAWTNCNLVTALTMLSQLEEAETLATEAQATLSEVGYSMGMYGTWVLSWLFILTGRYKKAEGLRLDQLRLNCQEWTADETLQAWHLPILEALAKLVELYSRTQCLDKAHRISSFVYKARAKVLGPKHSNTLNAMVRLGWSTAYSGQIRKGIRYTLRALEELKTSHPFHNVDITFSMYSLARLYNLNGQYAEAETLALELLSSESEIFLPKSITTIHTKAALGSAYCGQGKFLEAEKTLLEALELIKGFIGPTDLQTIDYTMELAKTYDGQGREKEAAALRLEAEELRKVTDVGLSAEERKERWDVVESVITWLEREVRGVEAWEPED